MIRAIFQFLPYVMMIAGVGSLCCVLLLGTRLKVPKAANLALTGLVLIAGSLATAVTLYLVRI